VQDLWRLSEVVAYAVGYCFCDLGLEGGAFQEGGFSAVCEVAHFDKDSGAASTYQDLVIGRLRAVTAEAGSGH